MVDSSQELGTAGHWLIINAVVAGMLIGSTDKTMLDVLMQEVGLRLLTLLCRHVERQRMPSADGGGDWEKLTCASQDTLRSRAMNGTIRLSAESSS